MFVDKVEFTVSSGKGGQGCVSYRREKFVSKGGPDGGDGGKGGNVYFITDNNTDTLSHFKGKRHLKAQVGQPGMPKKCTGKNGESLYIKVPPGTQVIDQESGAVLLDLLENDTTTRFLEGGKGGLGNWHFRSASNQLPDYAQPGLPGVEKEIRLELKLIADVGLVGFPNVGKSTLISTISNARPEVANYEFTTLTPNLGVVDVDDMRSFVMADIPGIIEGASDGRGLGLEFLRHIERTQTLLFMIDLANYRDIEQQYNLLREELKKYSEELNSRQYAIALTKVDAAPAELAEQVKQFMKNVGIKPSQKSRFGFEDSYPFYESDEDETDAGLPQFIAPVSSAANINVNALKFALHKLILNAKESDEADRP